MSKHYRFTDTMTFTIDTDKNTITIHGSYKFEDLEEAKKTVLATYEGYLILNENSRELVEDDQEDFPHPYFIANED